MCTGLDRVIQAAKGRPDASIRQVCCGLDGRDQRLLQWITDCGLIVLISDNIAVEASPARPIDQFPWTTHVELVGVFNKTQA